MDQVNEITERLKALGFSQEKVDETMNLLYQDLQEEMFVEFSSQTEETELAEYESRIKAAKSSDHLLSIIKEIGAKLHGDNAQSVITQKLVERLQQVEQMASNMKQNLEKYQAGDPATVQGMNEAMNTEEAQDIARGIAEES